MKNESYLTKKYIHPQRIYAYAEQFKYIREGERVLEVGGGGGVFFDLVRKVALHESVDIDPKTNPTYLADISKEDFILNNKKYDVVFCCQVLEHIILEKITIALNNLFSLTDNLVVVSLPDNRKCLGLSFFLGRSHFKKVFTVPFTGKTVNKGNHPEHEFELNGKNYRKIKSVLISSASENKFILAKNFRLFDRPYQHFFIFEKNK